MKKPFFWIGERKKELALFSDVARATCASCIAEETTPRDVFIGPGQLVPPPADCGETAADH